MSESVLLITEEEFENMKNHFIENNYASPHPREMGWDVRFAEFTGVKDIILRNKGFHLLIFNDYEKKESTLITYEKIDYDEVGREEFTFNSLDDFCSKLATYKKDLSTKNGTIQAIDWIINKSNFNYPINNKEIKYSSLLKYYQEIQSKENHEVKYLREHLNVGNLRHVVYMLCKEKGFSEKDLSEEINHTEKEITDLLNKGLVTDDLLNSICNYFNIKKTYEFTRYVQDSEKDMKIRRLKDKAIALRDNIKRNQKDIDNPALVTGIISELDFFIENVEER